MTGKPKALIALAAILTAAAPALARAQAAILLGSVRSDSADVPISHAEVAIPSLKKGSYTDSAGHFRMDNIKPGEYDVIVRRFGYQPLTLRMTFASDETTAQQFQLTPAVHVLTKVNVTAPDTARSLYVDQIAEFERRRSQGFGSFITGAELKAASNRSMTTVLHTIPQVRFYRLPTGAMVAGSTESSRRCYSLVYLDGIKVMAAFDVNSISPSSLRGIEFYPTTSAPSQFTAAPGYCGVLVIWTKVRN